MQWSHGQQLFLFLLQTAQVLVLLVSMLVWLDQLQMESLLEPSEIAKGISIILAS